MAELSPILAQLEQLYPKLLNRFDTALHREVRPQQFWPDPPIITLASKGLKRTQVGWYTPAIWKDAQEDVLAALAGIDATERVQVQRAEVTIATELLADPVETASELLRQTIVHIRSGKEGNTDGVVGANGYYPIWWEQAAQCVGFRATVLADQPSRGWADWKPRDDVDGWKQWVYANMNTAVFEVAREATAERVKPGSRMKKWRCGCTTVRCATQLVGHCDRCGEKFTWADKDVNPYDHLEGA